MSEPLKRCEYFLVQYAPSVLRESLVPVGLFLFETSGRLVGYGITQDWRPVRCLDPQADLRLLQSLPAHFERLVGESSAAAEASEGVSREKNLYEQLRRMQEDCSGSLRISLPRGVQTAHPEEEFQRLFQQYVERPRPLPQQRQLRAGSRPWIHAQLCEALRRHALWDRLRKDVPVEEFTAPGDGFRIDFAYRPNGIMKCLHAISLERDWNQAKLLSYTLGRIRQKTEALLTAIVADADPARPAVSGCRQILTEAQIAILPLSLLDPFVAGIRQELQPR